MNGIINVLKPSGVSSNKILNIIKRKYKGKKVGHFGTLDPMACGVLPVAIGKATRLFDYFLKKDKQYIALFKFGIETDTLDAEGKILSRNNTTVTKDMIENVLPNFIGEIMQVPPIYSAINLNGERAYNLARSGRSAEMPTKTVYIQELKLIKQIDLNSFLFKIHCSSGTYIRSLARDMAKALGTVGYMPQLIRTKAGIFGIDKAYTVEEVENEQFEIIKIEDAVNLRKFELPETEYQKLTNGVKVKANFDYEKDFLLFCNKQLFGIAEVKNNVIKIKTNLKE